MNKLSRKSTIVIISLSVIVVISLLFIFAGSKGNSSPGSSSPFPAHGNTGQELNNAMHSGEPTLVDFYATWCPICRVQTPITTSLKQIYSPSKVNILEMNIDQYHGLLLRYNPEGGVPTIVVFDKNGKVSKIDIGFTPKKEMESQINEVLNR
ncbi:thioredoxin [archaeon]|nr:thioredoxin [archaeon]